MTEPRKIQGKFYPLRHEEFMEINQKLKDAELRVYLYLITLGSFGDLTIEIDTNLCAVRTSQDMRQKFGNRIGNATAAEIQG